MDRINEEKSLFSPDPNPVPRKVHVSPAYADHLSSNFAVNYAREDRGGSSLPGVTPPVYQHQPSTTGVELQRKMDYASQLREQMRQDEERKARLKEEQVS